MSTSSAPDRVLTNPNALAATEDQYVRLFAELEEVDGAVGWAALDLGGTCLHSSGALGHLAVGSRDRQFSQVHS